MKVNTLFLQSYFVAVYNNGEKKLITDTIKYGCFPMVQHLEKSFGIKTVPSTVYVGKKVWTPIVFPYGRTKEYYLGFLNWCLNYTKENRSDFFDNEVNKVKFYLNNPIIDIKIIVKR